jgi:phage shock protein A
MMHPKFLKAMKAKVKRPVDPLAPPRPNLLSHDKEIRGMKTTGELAMQQIMQLQDQVHKLERKLARQTSYLDALHRQSVLKK